MRSVIYQSVTLPASAETLFDMYVDPAAHQAWSGSEVTVSAEPGSEFRAFDGALWGHMLQVVRPQLIVQSWRSTAFRESDPDSTLVMSFSGAGDEGRIDLVHVDVPEQDYDGVVAGWQNYYWTPWREFLLR